jgi:hypothetical protein
VNSSGQSADKICMDFLLPQILCFVLSSIVGYFIGRMTGLLNRDEQPYD